MTRGEAGAAVDEAVRRLLDNDSYLLSVNANERAISFRLGMYLQFLLPSYHVDCEYNRDGVEPKRIALPHEAPDEMDTDAITVFPDIIVHRRGTKENFVVIEIKKTTSNVDSEFDFAKLKGYKGSLGYPYALFLRIGCGEDTGMIELAWID